MAVTILYTPQDYLPAHNEIVYVVDSTNKTECSFEYIADVYVNGVFKIRMKKFPNQQGYGEFKINTILRNYIGYDLHNNETGVQTNPNSIISYQVKFGESYDSSALCDAGATLYLNLTTSSTQYAYNGVIQENEYEDYDYTNYIAGSTSSKFLTNFPNYMYIGENDSYYLNFFNITNGSIDYVKFTFYDANFNYIDEASISNTYSNPTSTERRLLTIACGPADIEAVTPGYFTSNVVYYTVSLLDGLTDVSEAKWFQLDKRCTNNPTKRFLFLGRLSGMESYSFTLRNTRRVKISRSEYTRLSGSFTSSSPTNWTIGKEERGRSVIGVNAQEEFEATTNWLSETEALWLEELFTSPEVYIYDENGNILPIIITSSSYEEITKRQKKMILYKITYELASKTNIQIN